MRQRMHRSLLPRTTRFWSRKNRGRKWDWWNVFANKFVGNIPFDRFRRKADVIAITADPDGRPGGKCRRRSVMSAEILLTEISDFCRSVGLAESTFGRAAINDGKLVSGCARRSHHHGYAGPHPDIHEQLSGSGPRPAGYGSAALTRHATQHIAGVGNTTQIREPSQTSSASAPPPPAGAPPKDAESDGQRNFSSTTTGRNT